MDKSTGRSHVPENPFTLFLLPRIPNMWQSLSALSWPGGPTPLPPPWGWFDCPKV